MISMFCLRSQELQILPQQSCRVLQFQHRYLSIYTKLGVGAGVYYFQFLRIFAKQNHHLVKVLWRRTTISGGKVEGNPFIK